MSESSQASTSKESNQIDEEQELTESERIQNMIEKIRLETAELTAKMAEESVELSAAKGEKAKNESRLKEIEDILENNKEDVDELRELLEEMDGARSRLREMRANAREELEDIESRIERAQMRLDGDEDVGSDDLQDELQRATEEFNNAKLEKAERARNVAMLQRRLDSSLSTSVRAQYEKRAIERLNDMARLTREQKQLMTLFNSLVDISNFTEKALSLTNKIEDVIPQIGRDEYRESFNTHLQEVNNGLSTHFKKTQETYATHVADKKIYSEERNLLQKRAGDFFRKSENFKKECEKNEILRKLLEDLKSS